MDFLNVTKDGSEYTQYQEKHLFKNGKELTYALYSFLMNVNPKLCGLMLDVNLEKEEQTIDPEEIAYMPADEFNEGYKYNRFTGRIIEK